VLAQAEPSAQPWETSFSVKTPWFIPWSFLIVGVAFCQGPSVGRGLRRDRRPLRNRIGWVSPQPSRKLRIFIPTSARRRPWFDINDSGWACAGTAATASTDQHQRQLQANEAHQKCRSQERRFPEEARHNNPCTHQNGRQQDGDQVFRHDVIPVANRTIRKQSMKLRGGRWHFCINANITLPDCSA